MAASINKSSLTFLKELSDNNNRDWFNTHKNRYLEAHQNITDFIDQLIVEMNKHDVIENASGKKSLFRIYSDVRFKKDKSPYNPRFAFSLQRSTKHRRGGYYMNIQPGNCFLACGFFSPNADDLLRIRQDISDNYDDWKKLLSKKALKDNFDGFIGDQLITTPKGFSKDDPAIELLRFKRFVFRHDFKDKEILAEDFVKTVNGLFKAVRPYFDHMSEVLTTDRNGESIFK